MSTMNENPDTPPAARAPATPSALSAAITLKPVQCSKCGHHRVWGDAKGNWWCAKCNPPARREQVRRILELKTFNERNEQVPGWAELSLESAEEIVVERAAGQAPLDRITTLQKETNAQATVEDFFKSIPSGSTFRGVLWHLYFAHQVHGDEFAADLAITIFDRQSEILDREDMESLVRELDLSKVGDRTARSILLLTKGWPGLGDKRDVLLVRLFERVSRGPGGDEKAVKFMRPLM